MPSADPVDASTPPPPPPPGPEPHGAAERWRPSPRLRRTALVIGMVLAVVVFARATRSEVRYDTDPSGAAPVDQGEADALARASAGTRCGGWPAALSTTGRPSVEPWHTALWADVAAFHVQSAHFFVRAVRFDVADGTASSAGLGAQASLTVPLEPGTVADVTVSCEASALTVHLLDANGKEVGDALLDVGAEPGVPAPVRLTKDGRAPVSRSSGCVELYDAAKAVAAAATPADRAEAARRLVVVARTTEASMDRSLTDGERADAATVIDLIESRIDDLAAGVPAADQAPDGDDAAALAGVTRAYERLCG